MTSAKPTHIALAEYFCSRDTIPPLSGIALTVAYKISVWSLRAQTRASLRKLDAARMDDIGLTPKQSATEAAKPFWRA